MKSMNLTRIAPISGILILILLTFGQGFAFADWKSILESRFDYVDTFDDLKPWTGSGYGDVVNNGSGFPVLVNGGASRWGYYSNWNRDYSQTWIGDHGAAYNWSGNQSLALDWGGSDGVNGPGRLGYSIGDKPSDGYPSDVYCFFMMRAPKAFFPMSGNSFSYFAYLKIFEIGTGFRDVWNWGTTAEQSNVVNSVQERNVYGLNYNVINLQSNSGQLYPKINQRYANPGPPDGVTNGFEGVLASAPVGSAIVADKWVGVEVRQKLSNPHGASNGSVEVWVYDDRGILLGSQLVDGIVTISDGSTVLSHGINKFVLGGNRSSEFSSAGSGTIYFDDFIVSSKRIGPTYFDLLDGGAPVVEPPPNLKIN